MIDLRLGDSRELLKTVPDQSISLIFTSPPYADQRKHTYGGVNPDRYLSWFLPFSEEFQRVLSPQGTFILNIKEKVCKGERHTYVLDLIIGLRNQGWLWTEEYIWIKKNPVPGKWPNRFRDSWERLLQFNLQRSFFMYQEEVQTPVSKATKNRLRSLSEKDWVRRPSATKSGFGKNMSNWIGRDKVYPTNVLYLAAETKNRKHSAVFPEALPEWFLRLFTLPGDTVLDPFVGSGTTLVVADRLNRHAIGFEINEEAYLTASRRIKND